MQGGILPALDALRLQVRSLDRIKWATGAALLLHVCGALGILFGNRALFLSLTPVNLLFMFSLAFWTVWNRPVKLFFDVAVICSIGFLVELLGVRTAIIFGRYSYGVVMGPQVAGVPLLIGITWFLVLAGSKVTSAYLLGFIRISRRESSPAWYGILAKYGNFALSAALAMGFDMVMEPAATRYGFWSWSGNSVPLYNYICWFFISFSVFSMFSRHLDPFSSIFLRRLWWILFLFFLTLDVLG